MGNFEIKSNDTTIVRYGVINFKLIKFEKSDNSKIKGNNTDLFPWGEFSKRNCFLWEKYLKSKCTKRSAEGGNLQKELIAGSEVR